MSRSSHRGHFQASSSSETEDDYLLYQRLDGNGRHIENDIIRIPRSQISSFHSVDEPLDQPCRSPMSRVAATRHPNSSKNALEYQRRNSTFLTKLNKMLMDELLHKNEYIEQFEAEVHKCSTKLHREQLENEKMMSQERIQEEDRQFTALKNTIDILQEQLDFVKAEYDRTYYSRQQSQRMTNDNTKAGEVAEILEESAGSDDDYLEDIEASVNSDSLSETDGTQESCESDGVSYELGQKRSKSEVRVEAGRDLPNLDINTSRSSPHGSFNGNDDEDIGMEVVAFSNNYSEHGYAPSGGNPGRNIFNQMNQFTTPLIVVKNLNLIIPSVNTTKTRISRSKISRSKITQEQRRIRRKYSCHSKRSKKTSTSHATDNVQHRESASTNEEPLEDNYDSDYDLKSSSSNSGHSDSEGEDGNQEADKSKSGDSGNRKNYLIFKKNKIDKSDQYQTVNPLISVRKSSMKGCRQIQKASASQQCENGCELFDDYADKSGSANRGNQVNYVTSGSQNVNPRININQDINAMPMSQQNRHSKSKSRQIQNCDNTAIGTISNKF